jgi:hypothetical protein
MAGPVLIFRHLVMNSPLTLLQPLSKILCIVATSCVVLGAVDARAQQIIHVPGDAPDLQTAINNVSDDGVVELAGGTYAAPSGGFTIYGGTKGFTMRAAAGAAVTLDGRGATDILRFTDSTHEMKFEFINFVNGVSPQAFLGGAVTLVNVQAKFVSCTFQNNAANAGTGGGGLWIVKSSAIFQNCTFDGNSSKSFGGGMSASDSSRVFVSGSKFTNNRTNLPGHSPSSAGAAIYGVDSSIQVSTSAFDNNQTGYAGGAIYLSCAWDRPVSQLSVTDCEFTGNQASRDPSVSFAAPAVGGAIHTETQVDTTLTRCRFTNNVARQGGALSLFQSVVQINSCVFKGNSATGAGSEEGFGGTIMALSSPDNDQRRTLSITATDTLFDGTGGSGAREGACIFAGGDLNAAFGINGAPQSGTAASNRAPVTLTRVAIMNFTANGGNGLPGAGGAILGEFVNLTIDDSIIANCGAVNSGAGLQLNQDSVATITNSVISNCNAGDTGAAITMFGGTLNASSTAFLNNRVNAGSRGAAFTTAPAVAGGGLPDFDMTGTIQNCIFGSNSGATVIYDGDRSASPFNRMQYSSNQFYPDDASVYIDDLTPPLSVARLNDLTIAASGTKKAPTANTAMPAPPDFAKLLLLPPVVAQIGAAGEATPIASYLAFASYPGTAALDGAPQPLANGIVPTTDDTAHTLTVGAAKVSTTPLPQAPLNMSTRLPVGTDQNVLIGGFIIAGPTQKRVLIRAIGPSLTVPGALQDPMLELHDHTGALVAQNDNWQVTIGGPLIAAPQAMDIQATAVSPATDAESALIATLNPFPETYTVVVRGANNTVGNALVEFYDLDATHTSTLANISTRGLVQTGDNVMIGGFIIGGGAGTTKVVARGLGPSLPVSTPLADPTLDLVNAQGTVVETNDDWGSGPHAADLNAANLAPSNSYESAIYRTDLPRAAYTAVLRGKGGGVGVGLVEVYVFE